MLIKLKDIPEEGLHLRYKENPEQLSVSGYVKKDVEIDAHIIKNADAISIDGSIEAELTMECSRCLKAFTFAINPHFSVNYIPALEGSDEDELELNKADMEIGFYKGDSFEIDDLIKEQIVLSIPMKPLCNLSCKGICPVCGQNLNIKECNCGQGNINPQFAVLKNLLKK